MKNISEGDVVALHTMANAILGITNDLTNLNIQKRHFEGSFNSIGLTFMYNREDADDPTKDVTIDLQLGTNDPLFEEWRIFEQKAIAAINQRIEEKRTLLVDVKEHIKKMK